MTIQTRSPVVVVHYFRHGQKGSYHGGLTELGERQMVELGKKIARFIPKRAVVLGYSSTVPRVSHSLDLVFQGLGRQPNKPIKLLKELNFLDSSDARAEEIIVNHLGQDEVNRMMLTGEFTGLFPELQKHLARVKRAGFKRAGLANALVKKANEIHIFVATHQSNIDSVALNALGLERNQNNLERIGGISQPASWLSLRFEGGNLSQVRYPDGRILRRRDGRISRQANRLSTS